MQNNTKNPHLRPLRSEFNSLLQHSTAGQGMQKLLDDYRFSSVLDVGCGAGWHSNILSENGKNVVAIDYAKHPKLNMTPKAGSIVHHISDFMAYEVKNPFDCVWCAHVLEHQLNPHDFILKLKYSVKEQGVIAITVPPLKHDIVGGHVSLWNGGLLLYHLVLAGLDCSHAAILQYGYNISIILQRKDIQVPKNLRFANGDLETLAPFMPSFVQQGFDGNINCHNWYKDD